jgi:hypothetical protein
MFGKVDVPFHHGTNTNDSVCLFCDDRDKVMIYLRWAQWLFRCGLRHLNHVVINMDETSVSANHDTDKGWVVNAGVRAASNLTTTASRSGGPVLTCTLLGCICSDSLVQPHLPQVFLPKARGSGDVPNYVMQQFAGCGAPQEFWHGTNGWVDFVSMKHWATRLRSVVQSCHGLQTWIVLVLDCATCHLDVRTIRHLRQLGIVVLLIPSKLTYLLQPCDVEVFGVFKDTLRRASLLKRLRNENGNVTFADWVSNVSETVHGIISNVDWSDTFSRVGLSREYESLRSDIAGYVGEEDLGPRLPSVEEFAELIGRPAQTELTHHLYRLILLTHVELPDLPIGSMPRAGAVIDLPDLPRVLKRPVHWEPPPHAEVGQALQDYLAHSGGNPQPVGGVFREARHFARPIGAVDGAWRPAVGLRPRRR